MDHDGYKDISYMDHISHVYITYLGNNEERIEFFLQSFVGRG